MIKKITKNKKKFNLLVIIFAIAISFLVEFGILLYKNHEFKNNKGEIDLTDEIVYTTETVEVAKEQKAKTNNILEILEEDSSANEEGIEEEPKIEYEERVVTRAEIILDAKYYIDKLRVNYETKEDTNVNFNCVIYNEYGNPSSKSYFNLFEKEYNFLERNIGKDVSKISFNLGENNSKLNIKSIIIVNKTSFNIIRFIFILFINLLIASFIIFRDKFKLHIEIFFAVIVMLIGSLIILCTPTVMHTLWDDMVHFPSTYNLFSKNNITTKSINYALKGQNEYNNNSASINEIFRMYKYLNKNTYKTVLIEEKSSTFISYADYAYIPSGIVLKICQILKIPFVPMYWLGKFINLVIYALVGYYTIKHAKIGKNILFVLFLIPSNLYLACQYSKDSYVTGLLMLGISKFANICVSKDKITLKEILIFVLAILFGSFSKAIYIPFLFLVFLIPSNKFNNKKQSMVIKIIVCGITLFMLSSFIFPTVVNTSSNEISDIRGGDNVSVSRQIQLILQQPISFIKIFKNNFFNSFFIGFILSKYTFGDFNHFMTGNDNLYWIFVFAILLSILSNNSSKEKLNGKTKIFMALITIVIMCFIMLSMYLSFNNVGSTFINGVQRRYYLPLLLPILLIVFTDKIKHSIDTSKINFVIIVITSFVCFKIIYDLLLLPLWM